MNLLNTAKEAITILPASGATKQLFSKMGLKKKKNVIILTLCMAVSFILYQLYFFLTITSESNRRNIILPVMNHDQLQEIVHIRSEADVHINDHGIIKGVLYLHMPRYRPDSNNEFKCLKSEYKIPFESVNDDYCDCEDGSDEPSTSACVNGTFYCDTQYGKKPLSLLEVPSSRVNDGICDCCDGSDEWLSVHKTLVSQSNAKHYRFYVTKCPNNCQL